MKAKEGEKMKTFPEFYIKGSPNCGFFNTALVDKDGNISCGFSTTRKVQRWKTKKCAEKWLTVARQLDPNAELVNNTVTI